jgi:hypothetical protein
MTKKTYELVLGGKFHKTVLFLQETNQRCAGEIVLCSGTDFELLEEQAEICSLFFGRSLEIASEGWLHI